MSAQVQALGVVRTKEQWAEIIDSLEAAAQLEAGLSQEPNLVRPEQCSQWKQAQELRHELGIRRRR